MSTGYFITGTDTGIGKTRSTVALMHYFRQQGKSVLGMKPVATGCFLNEGVLVNDDALLLQQHATDTMAYNLINPYAFSPPVSPNIAAQQAGLTIDIDKIHSCYKVLQEQTEIVLVEGVGGWMVPLSDDLFLPDLASKLNLPVIIVVGIKLGCINHALLTFQAVKDSGLPCAGWIGSCVEPEVKAIEEIIRTLKNSTLAPLLGVMPYSKRANFDFIAKIMNFKNLQS